MKNLKLEFQETNIKQKSDETLMTLVFKGTYGTKDEPNPMTLTVAKCSETRRLAFLEELGIVDEGDIIFITQGINPQKKLDEFFVGFVRRKDPQMVDFLEEIAEFDEEQKKERYTLLNNDLTEMVRENTTETKKFDALFGCLEALYKVVYEDDAPFDKEDYIRTARLHLGINEDEDNDEDPSWGGPD